MNKCPFSTIESIYDKFKEAFDYTTDVLIFQHDQKQEKHYETIKMKGDKTPIRNMESALKDVHASLGIRNLLPKRRHTNAKIEASHLHIMQILKLSRESILLETLQMSGMLQVL